MARRRTNWLRSVEDRLFRTNEYLWCQILDAHYKIAIADTCRDTILRAHNFRDCGHHCATELPTRHSLKECMAKMNAFLHFIEDLDATSANTLAFQTLRDFDVHFVPLLRRLIRSAERHHGQNGTRLPWINDLKR